MPTSTQISNILAALNQINQAIPQVQSAVSLVTDPNNKYQLTVLGIQLTNIQTTLTQSMIAADDAIFAADTTKLNAQAATLRGQANNIQAILTGVATAGQILGYITQALAVIAVI
jgi:hypothetical protein